MAFVYQDATLAKVPPISQVVVGKVIDVLAGPRWYKIRIGADMEMPAYDGCSYGSFAPFSPVKIGLHSPGTYVLLAIRVSESSKYLPPAFIIASIPTFVDNNSLRWNDWITQFNGTDAVNMLTHTAATSQFSKAFRDYNNYQPLDAIPGSDEGLMNELGVAYGISRFYTWMRASELAGIWFFYLDNLVRLSSYNYEQWLAGGEKWHKNDEGEISEVELFTPYPWEALGRLEPGLDAGDETKDGGRYRPGQNKLLYEPKEARQALIPRRLRLSGYLGDINREMVILPKIDPGLYDTKTADFVEKLNRHTKYTGVLDIHQHSDGLYSVRSAQGIVLEKYIYIPVPKQTAVPEDKDSITPPTVDLGVTSDDYLGDGLTNYRPAAYWGKPTVPTTLHDKEPYTFSDPLRPDLWAAELYDYHAYMFNWYGCKGTVAHQHDWFTPDEVPTGKNGEGADISSNFPKTDVTYADETKKPKGATTSARGTYEPTERLSSRFAFSLPKFSEIKIDHRKGSSRYYWSRSCLNMLPDGSVLIEDGYGSSIFMTGGNILMSGAGDVWIKPGRSVVVWAPDDAVIRAGSSVDITSSNADVRIKAERNLHMLAGNSGIMGGVLIESRAAYDFGGEFKFRDEEDNPLVGEDVQTYGIIMRSTKAPTMVYGQDVYVKAMNDAGPGIVGGNIVIDADSGVTLSGYEVMEFAKSGITHILGQRLEEGGAIITSSVVNRFDQDNTMFGSTGVFMSKAEYALFDTQGTGQMLVNGSVGIVNGVMPYPGSVLSSMIVSYSSEYTQWLTGTDPDDLPAILNYQYLEAYLSGIKGDTTFISYAGFTCRNEAQYGLHDDFFLAEARWQQMYRDKGIGIVWYEPIVEIPGVTMSLTEGYTRPHPGHTYWVLYERYVQYDPELWDWTDGRSAKRGASTKVESPYDAMRKKREEGTAKSLQYKVLSNHYIVSNQYGQNEGSSL
jgi:hypothetical protein